MNSEVEFGLFDWIDHGNIEVADLYEQRLQLIEIADDAGFYGYHLAEHHGTSLGMAPSPSVFFSALAQRTNQIRFSAMAFLLPLYHPVRLAEEICMLDHLSNGRIEVGISRGVSPYELRGYGVDPNSTQDLFKESLEVIQKCMIEDSLSYDGKHFKFDDLQIPIKPKQKPNPPFWYPTFSAEGTKYAASHGFNFITLGPPELASQLAALYRETLTESEQPKISNKQPKIGAMRQVFIADNDQEAIKIAKPAYNTWYNSITELWHKNNDGSFDDFFSWDSCLDNETILIGSTETVKSKLLELVEKTGINYFVASFAWGSLPLQRSQESMQRFIEEIAPALRT